jgi:hypothetical protein
MRFALALINNVMGIAAGLITMASAFLLNPNLGETAQSIVLPSAGYLNATQGTLKLKVLISYMLYGIGGLVAFFFGIGMINTVLAMFKLENVITSLFAMLGMVLIAVHYTFFPDEFTYALPLAAFSGLVAFAAFLVGMIGKALHK